MRCRPHAVLTAEYVCTYKTSLKADKEVGGCFFLRFNGDHVEGTSCGSKSKDDHVCLHWEAHVVQWEVARKKNAIFKRKIAFFFVSTMVAMEIM